jgi:hypothetical protein
LAGSANQHRHATTLDTIGDGGIGQILVRSKRKILIGIRKVDQVVRDLCTLDGRRFRRSDIHQAIHLSGVRPHNLTAQSLREFNAKRGLTGRRTADQRD